MGKKIALLMTQSIGRRLWICFIGNEENCIKLQKFDGLRANGRPRPEKLSNIEFELPLELQQNIWDIDLLCEQDYVRWAHKYLLLGQKQEGKGYWENAKLVVGDYNVPITKGYWPDSWANADIIWTDINKADEDQIMQIIYDTHCFTPFDLETYCK